MKDRVFLIVLVVAVFLVMFQNCSGKGSFSTSVAISDFSSGYSDNVFDNGDVNQKPRINCRIKRKSDGVLVRTIDTLSGFETFGSAGIVENEPVIFDCSNSQDDTTTTANLKFEVSDPLDPKVFNNVGTIFEINFNQYGSYPMAVRVADTEGESITKTFNVNVQCSGTRPQLVIDKSKVTITSDGAVGYFNFNAGAAVTGGSEVYTYSWDFNGDSRFDLYDILTPVQWSSSSQATHVYTNFGGTRKVGLKVMDSCFNIASAEVDYSFTIPRYPAGAKAGKLGYYYLQADISPTYSTDLFKYTNVNFIGTQLPGLSERKRVTCDYPLNAINTATGFTIKALNFYDNGANTNLMHGMTMSIYGIKDNGSAMQTFSSADADINRKIYIGANQYFVAESTDGRPKQTYMKSKDCSVSLTLERAQAVSPCSPGGTAVPAGTATLYGEFNCPNLSAPGFTDIQVENGYFFCEVSYSDQCVGGGGGGGGGQPPKAQ